MAPAHSRRRPAGGCLPLRAAVVAKSGAAPAPAADDSGKKGLGGGAIAAIVICILLCLALLPLAVRFVDDAPADTDSSRQVPVSDRATDMSTTPSPSGSTNAASRTASGMKANVASRTLSGNEALFQVPLAPEPSRGMAIATRTAASPDAAQEARSWAGSASVTQTNQNPSFVLQPLPSPASPQPQRQPPLRAAPRVTKDAGCPSGGAGSLAGIGQPEQPYKNQAMVDAPSTSTGGALAGSLAAIGQPEQPYKNQEAVVARGKSRPVPAERPAKPIAEGPVELPQCTQAAAVGHTLAEYDMASAGNGLGDYDMASAGHGLAEYDMASAGHGLGDYDQAGPAHGMDDYAAPTDLEPDIYGGDKGPPRPVMEVARPTPAARPTLQAIGKPKSPYSGFDDV